MLQTTKPVSLEIDTGDGRKIEVLSAYITSLSISQEPPEIADFETWAGDFGSLMMKEAGPITIEATFRSKDLPNLFFDEEILEENDMDHGEEFCRYCGSDWIPDRRGNCGACGGPKIYALGLDE